ncbi:MAG: DUF1538 domain-containing protein [Nitrospinales bacterium]
MEHFSEIMEILVKSLQSTFQDIFPILTVILFFQVFILKMKIPQLKRILFGTVLVVLGLAIFLVGLEEGIFPLGFQMADQLADLKFLSSTMGLSEAKILAPNEVDPTLYFWIYIFAFSIGFSTTLAEPALIAVAIKAKEISSGAISTWGLRIAVAFGVAVGITLGVYRIVTGTPLYIYVVLGYVLALIQTCFAPKLIVPLAYDSGGVTTSTVTVPLVAALGIGLATNVPGRSALLDGFGLIALASLFPMITVMGYAMITQWYAKFSKNNSHS